MISESSKLKDEHKVLDEEAIKSMPNTSLPQQRKIKTHRRYLRMPNPRQTLCKQRHRATGGRE